jgi:hypothetical protein
MDNQIRMFQVENPVDLWQEQLAQKKQQLLQLNEKLFEVEQNIQRTTQQVRLYREQLEAQPQIYTLAQSFITSEALWENLGRSDSPLDISSLRDLQLKSEHLNPVHEELLTNLVNSQVMLNTQIPFREFCLEKGTNLENEIERLGTLLTSKKLELQKLELKKNEELQKNESERDRKLKEINLLQQSYQTYFDETARGFGEAENLQNFDFSEIVISAAASTPFEATRPKRMYIAIVALFVFFLLSLLVAGYIEITADSP